MSSNNIFPARKHTGKVGPRAVKKSPVRKSNGHSSPSPKTTKQPSSPLTDNGDTIATQGSTCASPSKADDESHHKSEVELAKATSAQGGETAMDTSMEADLAGRDDGDQLQGPGSSKAEETGTPTKPTEEEERSPRDSKKAKQKIHPFFGMYSSTMSCVCLCACNQYTFVP